MDAPSPTMNAILQPAYGPPDVLVHAAVPTPSPAEDGVLVRVLAASLNRGDWHLLTGTPYPVRAAFGFGKPRQPILGMAIAGRVVAVGSKVRTFAVGDGVMAEVSRGGFAEYACVKETDLARVPAALSFEDAATLPVAAPTALQGLRDAGGLVAGQAVLVNGAAGGVGTFAVQIAKALGATVTGVCSAGNVELVRSLGADHVIDYGTEDFTAGDRRYDLIFDLVGNHPLAAYRRVLTERGRIVSGAGGADNLWTGPMGQILGGLASNPFHAQKFVSLLQAPNPADLAELAAMVEAGTLRPVVTRRCTLPEVPDAMRQLGTGRTRGKIVVTC